LRKTFWSQGNFYVTSGELINEMIKEYLDRHFEPKAVDSFRAEDQTGFFNNLKTDINKWHANALSDISLQRKIYYFFNLKI